MKPKSKDTEEKLIAQTVKLDAKLFIRLKTFSARARMTHQDILRTALVDYLRKMQA